MASHISILACFLLLGSTVISEDAEDEGHYIDGSWKKSFEGFDEISGPVFNYDYGGFAYAKVKNLKETPPAIEVTLEIFKKGSSAPITSTKKFVSDDGNCTKMSAKLQKLEPTVLTITQTLFRHLDKTSLVEWDPFRYPLPNLNLGWERNFFFMSETAGGEGYNIVVHRNSICKSHSGNCIIEFPANADSEPVISAFYVDEDDPLDRMQIKDYFNGPLMHLIRGFDVTGSFKYLECVVPDWRNGCNEKLELLSHDPETGDPKALNFDVDSYSLRSGLCLMEIPDRKTVRCLKFDHSPRAKRRHPTMDYNVTYSKPMKVLDVYDTEFVILVLARKAECSGNDCLTITVDEIYQGGIGKMKMRRLMRGIEDLECSSDDKVLDVHGSINREHDTITIEYVCESADRFIYKSVDFYEILKPYGAMQRDVDELQRTNVSMLAPVHNKAASTSP